MSAWLCGIYLQFCIVGRHIVPCNRSGPEWQRIGNEIDAAMIRARALTEEDAGDRATSKLQDRNYKRGGPLLNDASF